MSETVLIIGASSGVGRAAVEAFGAEGARIVAVSRDANRLEQALAEVGTNLDARELDATDADALGRLLAEVRPDVIVLSAGCRPKLGTVDDHTWETFSEPWNQDVKMTFELGQAVLRLPLKAGSRVIFLSSGAGLGGSPLSGGYAGAKRMQMFLAGYFQGVAKERSLGIRFVAVVPKQLIAGTPIAEAAGAAYAARAGLPLEKFMQRFGAPLFAGGVAEALVGVARGRIGADATVVGVSGNGTEIL